MEYVGEPDDEGKQRKNPNPRRAPTPIPSSVESSVRSACSASGARPPAPESKSKASYQKLQPEAVRAIRWSYCFTKPSKRAIERACPQRRSKPAGAAPRPRLSPPRHPAANRLPWPLTAWRQAS